MTQTLALPRFEDATVVVPAPGHEPGNWSGAASAVLVDGVYWLTYRVRRPLREGSQSNATCSGRLTARPSSFTISRWTGFRTAPGPWRP